MNHWEAMTPTERHDTLQRVRDKMFELVMRDLVAAGQWLSIPEASDLASHLRRTRRTCISALNYPTERAAATGCTGTPDVHSVASLAIATHDPAREHDAADILEELEESLFHLPGRGTPDLRLAVAEMKRQVDALPLLMCTSLDAVQAEGES